MAENSFKKRLTEDGFVLIPNILDGKQIISLRSSLNNIYEKGPRYEGDTKKVRFDLLGRYSELNWLLFHEPLLKALRNLLGEDFIMATVSSSQLLASLSKPSKAFLYGANSTLRWAASSRTFFNSFSVVLIILRA